MIPLEREESPHAARRKSDPLVPKTGTNKEDPDY
jgi:hypothetical protein